MFLRVHVGTAKADDDTEYEMSLISGNTPLIKSKQTGKYFQLTWPEIIDLAVAAGIDQPAEEK
jgi:hypothetical protein